MKKLNVIALAVLLCSLALPTLASAQGPEPSLPLTPDGPSPCGALRWLVKHPGILQVFQEKVAASLSLTADELRSRLKNGETLLQVAKAQGFNGAELRALLGEVQSEIVEEALAAGRITSDEAAALRERIQALAPGQAWRSLAARRCLLPALRLQLFLAPHRFHPRAEGR